MKKEKLLEVMNDIRIKEITKQNILDVCISKADAEEVRKVPRSFRISEKNISFRQAAIPAMIMVLAFSIAGYELLSGILPGPDQTSRETSSKIVIPIVLSVPNWFSPGILLANRYHNNILPGMTLKETLSSQYIYVDMQEESILATGEHENCRNFRFNVGSGSIECVDHIIRATLISENIMKETDMIYFQHCVASDEFALIDIRNEHKEYQSTYRFNLQTKEFIEIKEDLNQIEAWVILKDYSTLVTSHFDGSVWGIFLVDVISGKSKNIVSEENATSLFDLSPGNKYIWYSLLKDGNKNLRCIYNIADGTRTYITSDNYPFFTPDDRYMLYFSGNSVHRLDLENNEDIVLAENAQWAVPGGMDIEAYDDTTGKIILSDFDNSLHYDLYSLDTNKQPEPITEYSAREYIFDKTGKYLFYYTDHEGNDGKIFCYDIASGESFSVDLPEDFVNKMTSERKNILHPDEPLPADYRLYLSDDSRNIYLTYSIYHIIYSDTVPLAALLDYAEQNDTIIHFGEICDQRYYGSELEGRSYSVNTDSGKIAVLNENYTTRKFSLILYDQAIDTSKPYNGGEVLVQKDLPADADWFLADWWEAYYEQGTPVYSLDSVIDFVKTHDNLDGFVQKFSEYSIGINHENEKEIGFFYQICVGPNDYVNVTENYTEMKLQIFRGGELIFEKELDPAITNSDRLPK